MREMTANEARLRSALEAALVALEVAADPANDIDPDGFAVVAKACRAALGCADYAACGTVVEGTTLHDAACPLSADNPPDEGELLLWCESLCCDNPCAGGRRQWPISAMRDGYCPICAATRDLTAPRADCGVCGLSLTEAETRTHECPDDPHGDEARGIMSAVVAHGARAFDPRADAPEGALNARDVQEYLGGRDPREVR